ncbi:MAG: AMP-binding protein [Lachnospiraceae bacterium]|nr:AMP-binding protein [Lachnospiraceae bacterium]
MKNKSYPLYKVELITDLREMLEVKRRDRSLDFAFAYFLRDDIRYVSYGVFADEVSRLGNYILTDDRFGNHIGILGENSYEWLLAYFAIVNTGRVAVLFDKDMTDSEIESLTTKFDVDSFFFSEKNASKVPESKRNNSICLNEIDSLFEIEYRSGDLGNDLYDKITLEPDRCCCIFFTSGTTGERKGVMLSHSNIAFDIVGSSRLFRLEGNTYTVLPFHHAFGLIVGVLMVFHYGYTVYLSSGLKRIKKELLLSKPQTMMLVPLFIETFKKQICDAVRKEDRERMLSIAIKVSDYLYSIGIDLRKRLFSSIRDSFGGNLEYIICGGAALDNRYIAYFRSFGIEILCGYGTTECSPCVGVNRNHYHVDGSVGVPIPGSEAKIADDGEVLIRGPHVMLGYYGDESASTDVLTVDGWYKTGDLGLIDDNGFITLTGRKKNLIIRSNGENVSPEELEERIKTIEGVEEVVVSDDNGQIKAEIYSSEQNIHDAVYKGIESLNRVLPSYKRIEKTVFRDVEFEKTTSMKIKR